MGKGSYIKVIPPAPTTNEKIAAAFGTRFVLVTPEGGEYDIPAVASASVHFPIDGLVSLDLRVYAVEMPPEILADLKELLIANRGDDSETQS